MGSFKSRNVIDWFKDEIKILIACILCLMIVDDVLGICSNKRIKKVDSYEYLHNILLFLLKSVNFENYSNV